MTTTIGVDPGATGAIAMLDADGQLLALHDMPYADGQVLAPVLATIMRHGADGTAWVEQLRSRPGQSAPAMWKFATGYGVILGVLGALTIPTRHVTPSVWKRAAQVTKDKGSSRRLACELWPEWADRFARVKDDGRAEAALIARHGWQDATR